MHVDSWGVAQELVYCRKVQIFAPAFLRGSAKNNLRYVFFANYLGDFLCNGFSGDSDDLCSEVFPEAYILRETSLVLRIVVYSDIDINHKQFSIDPLCHAGSACDQILGCRAGTDTHRDAVSQR